jgi:hypothetical protein
MHFTPTSASWLNMVERFFRESLISMAEWIGLEPATAPAVILQRGVIFP